MNRDHWNDLIIESSARPLPLPDDRFRAWMAGRNIFVSSRMDEELNPAREAARIYLHSMGANPMMWEAITPQDKGPQRAYLDGVDQSSVFVLILGSRYGIADASGYSPTHQEGNRAAERKIPRLLFTLAGVKASERDGRLNDWLNSLYNEISGAPFTSPDDLVGQLSARLREMAAQSERIWIKLGNLVFPGQVTSQFGAATSSSNFTVTARVTGSRVRHALLALGQPLGSARVRADRLTWSDKSFPVQVESVSTKAEFAAEDEVEVKCRVPSNWYGESGSSLAMMTLGGGPGGQSMGPAELAAIWARRAILGEDIGEGRGAMDLAHSLSAPETKTLPEVLAAANASGWLAEGLTKLYAVEEVTRRYGAHFEHLEVGPATATGIRIDGAFTLGAGISARNESVRIQGIVTLKR